MPFELRPYPTPTLRPEGEYLQSAWTKSVYPLAESLGVPIRLPTVSPQPYTNLAFQGLELAKDQGKADAYNDAVFRAFFQRSEDIGNLDVLTTIAAGAGLDAAKFREALRQGAYADRVRSLLQRAYQEMRITAVPTFVIGRRRLSGLYPAEALARVVDDELRSRAG